MADSVSKIVIAGASGFIGRALIEALQPEYDIIGLSRSEKASEPGLEWRRCDLFSLLQAEAALAGADYAIYLVHSPQQRAGLTQASYADLDLILADNFVRAAHKAGVKQIVYLGNLIPAGVNQDTLPPYLRSRLEVEQVLQAYDIPVTLLRAPVVIGAGGAAFELARTLIHKVPIMLVPRWTRTLNQAIALRDVVACVHEVLAHPASYGQSYDIAGPEAVSYLDLLRATAQALPDQLSKPIRMMQVPVLTPLLSRYWLTWKTGLPLHEVIPLLESLLTPALAQDQRLQKSMGQEPLPLAQAIQLALAKESTASIQHRPPVSQPTAATQPKHFKDLRSVQRLPLQAGQDALWLAREYVGLLGRLLWPLMRTQIEANHHMRIYQRGLRKPLLQLDYSPERSSPDRALFYINGGLLAQQTPGVPSRLEFRVIPGDHFALVGIHDFRPRLPWYLYLLTQANFHLWTMYAFIWYLRFKNRNSYSN